jgi:hypothetical protein
MEKSRFIYAMMAVLIVLSVGCSQDSKDEKKSNKTNIVQIFNEKDFTGWEQKNGTAAYEVIDGVMVGSTVLDSPNSFMCTVDEYADFILEFDVKVDTNLNSGVQIRSHSLADYNDYQVHGYQVEIDPSPRSWSGGIYDEARRGWLADLENNEEGRKAFKNGEWNHYKIEANGPSIKTWINGVPTAELIDSMDATGFIAFQVHSAKEEGLQVKWKNIKLELID